MIDKNEENILINPDTVKRKKIGNKITDTYEPMPDMNMTASGIELNKIENTGGKVTIEYETKGRFGNPAVLNFKEYEVEDINDLGLTRQEKIFETIVTILNKNKDQSSNVDIGDLLIEEIMETLIGLKMYTAGTAIHNHPWMCDCQSNLPQDEQKVNETDINLRELHYVSIEEADEKVKAYFKTEFEKMSKEEWLEYVKTKYASDPIIDPAKVIIEDEVKKIKIKEPIIVKDNDNNTFSFRFMRVKDLINAQKLAENKYGNLIKGVKNKIYPGVTAISDLKSLKDKDIQALQEKQAKETILLAKALTLLAKNGQPLTPDQALETYRKMPLSVIRDYINFTNAIEFGICDEYKFTCPLCGEVKTRWLQQEFIPIEFLPFDSNTKREQRKSTGANIYFGI